MFNGVKHCLANGHDPALCDTVCQDVQVDQITVGDSRDLLKCLPAGAVNLVVTSPPYANARKKQYGGVHPDDYVEWFTPFADELYRVLADDGSFVININDRVINGERHSYVFDLVTSLQKRGWKWMDTFIWKKTDPFPRKPVRRFKDGVEYIFHFTKNIKFKFRPDRGKVPAAPATLRRLERLGRNDFRHNPSSSGSGLGVHKSKMAQGILPSGKVFPSNVLTMATESSNKKHPAPFPEKLPAFFIETMSDEGDVVLDLFGGSGTTVKVAKEKCRRYIGFDQKSKFVEVAKERLDGVDAQCSTE